MLASQESQRILRLSIVYLLFDETVFGVRRFKVEAIDSGSVEKHFEIAQVDVAQSSRDHRQEWCHRPLREVHHFGELIALETFFFLLWVQKTKIFQMISTKRVAAKK